MVHFPFSLYTCEVWFHALREENKLKLFGNKVLRKMFGPKKDEGSGEFGLLCNEELCV